MKRQDVKPVKGPRTHANCQLQYKCNRPGKTAVAKSKPGYTTGKNRRLWDDTSKQWYRV